MDALTREPLIRGEGTPDDAWLAWPGFAELPRLALHGWLTAASRLVVVAPHPDDEVLACGALLSMHTALGGAARVIAVTDGEASHRGSAQWPPQRLAAARRAVSSAGLAQLASQRIPTTRLGLPDGAVTAHAGRLVSALQRMLQPGDTVVSTWREDGHPDHDACGAAAAQACARVGCRLLEAPVWMWHWAAPGDVRVPWHRLRSLPLSAEAQARKRLALDAHTTQLSAREAGLGPVLSAVTLARLARDSEHFFI